MFLWEFNSKQKIFSCTWFKLAKEGSHYKNDIKIMLRLVCVVNSVSWLLGGRFGSEHSKPVSNQNQG